MDIDYVNLLTGVASTIVIIGFIAWLIWQVIKLRNSGPQKSEVQVIADAAFAKAINDVSPFASVVADTHGRIVYVNKSTTDLLYWRYNELIGKNIDMMIPDQARARHNKAMEDYRISGHSPMFDNPLQLHCVAKGGVSIPVEIIIEEMPVDGQMFILGKIRDRTHELKETAALRKELGLYQQCEQDAFIGFFEWQFVEDTVFMSPNMLNIFDLNKVDNNAPAQVLTDCVISNDRKKVADAILNAVNNKHPLYEVDYYLRNGRRVRTIAAVHYDEQEEVVFINGACRDITNKNGR